MDQQRRSQPSKDGGRLFGALGRVRRDAHVQRLALADGGVERAHGLFQRRLGVKSMRVEDVDVLEAHPSKALVEAGQQIFSGAPDPIRPGPHVVAGLTGNHQLVAVAGQVRLQDATEVFLGGAVGRSVVVGQVEMRDAQVEGPAEDRSLGLERAVMAEVLPQSERDGRQEQAAASGPPVRHPGIALAVLHHIHAEIWAGWDGLLVRSVSRAY